MRDRHFFLLVLLLALAHPLVHLLGWDGWASVIVFTTPSGGLPEWGDGMRGAAFFLSWGSLHLLCPILLLARLFVAVAEAVYRRRASPRHGLRGSADRAL